MQMSGTHADDVRNSCRCQELMQMSGTHADVRNSFLSGVLGESIVEYLI
jgi:hypothetical protein